MFTQAGFAPISRAICKALVSRLGTSGLAVGYLVRWPSGETAWGSRTQIVWPEQVRIRSFFHVHTEVLDWSPVRRSS
jgi:hypothetical protein